jgi:hypothetical protein
MILLLGIEIFSIIPEEQVSLIFWVIRHLDAFYSSELPWLSGRNEKDNSNFAEGVSKMADPKINSEDGLVSRDHGSEEGSAKRRVAVCFFAATILRAQK